MKSVSEIKYRCFHSFEATIEGYELPQRFTMMNGDEPHPFCIVAAKELQYHLDNEAEWDHNFGLTKDDKGAIIGKMFGVLIVRSKEGETGYLTAFSGKLGGVNHHAKFVPPVFDSLTENSFVNIGMTELTHIIQSIKDTETNKPEGYKEQVTVLKEARKNHSIALQQQIFDHYHFLNKAGKEKSLVQIFADAGYKNPPSGAGECAGPKLLQYAFQHQMRPLAIAEFWWGQSPKSATWKHGHYYACCKEKCEPILAHMLAGVDY